MSITTADNNTSSVTALMVVQKYFELLKAVHKALNIESVRDRNKDELEIVQKSASPSPQIVNSSEKELNHTDTVKELAEEKQYLASRKAEIFQLRVENKKKFGMAQLNFVKSQAMFNMSLARFNSRSYENSI
ncbi:MAG: hypothetical protein SAK29_11585 [Scytonema sp. PMC 1069.18]|nr:hypothetical protein [Scytonema sp. PMC 1069.18]